MQNGRQVIIYTLVRDSEFLTFLSTLVWIMVHSTNTKYAVTFSDAGTGRRSWLSATQAD